jgi:hypothetical protein
MDKRNEPAVRRSTHPIQGLRTGHIQWSDDYGTRFLAISGKWRFGGLQACERPGVTPGLGCWFGVEPPAGIEPATPSLPWNHREPLCEPPFAQVAHDRWGESYGFSSGEGMRSLSVTLFAGSAGNPTGSSDCVHILPWSAFTPADVDQSAEQYGSSAHRVTAASAARRTAALSTSMREGEILRSGHTQMKARGPGGGRGRAR